MVGEKSGDEIIKHRMMEHWDDDYKRYQEKHKISENLVHYGPNCPTEDDLHLLGDVRGKHIAEFGCGGGQCSIALVKRGATCTGIDFSRKQLEFAQGLAEKSLDAEQRGRIQFIWSDLERMDAVPDSAFDIGFSAFCFDWIQDFPRLFAGIRRKLKISGFLVFSLGHPFYKCLDEQWDGQLPPKLKNPYFQREDWEEDEQGRAIRYKIPTLGDLFSFLADAGFQVERLLEPEPINSKGSVEAWDFSDDYPPEVARYVPVTLIIKASVK
ncbi:MAG: methyltransferase domain-containing protein [Candidatus Lokiarchaeota archaeon]|nr:methyltransferase domain-containing protein [Candidatus Lokiarchaeota archaeon]